MAQIPRFSFPIGFLSLLLTGCVPIWQVCHIGSGENTCAAGFLWEAVVLIPLNLREAGLIDAVFRLQGQNAILCAFVFTIGAAFGRGILDVWASRRSVRHAGASRPFWQR